MFSSGLKAFAPSRGNNFPAAISAQPGDEASSPPSAARKPVEPFAKEASKERRNEPRAPHSALKPRVQTGRPRRWMSLPCRPSALQRCWSTAGVVLSPTGSAAGAAGSRSRVTRRPGSRRRRVAAARKASVPEPATTTCWTGREVMRGACGRLGFRSTARKACGWRRAPAAR